MIKISKSNKENIMLKRKKRCQDLEEKHMNQASSQFHFLFLQNPHIQAIKTKNAICEEEIKEKFIPWATNLENTCNNVLAVSGMLEENLVAVI